MELNKEIKQKKFINEWQKSIVNLIFTHSWLKTRLTKHLKPFGITMQQYNVLRILNGQYPRPISTSVIRDRMLDKMSDASRIVERLYKKDLVKRKPCSTDRRLVDVVITEKGRALIKEIDVIAAEMTNIFGKLSEAEAQQLNTLLDKIRS